MFLKIKLFVEMLKWYVMQNVFFLIEIIVENFLGIDFDENKYDFKIYIYMVILFREGYYN